VVGYNDFAAAILMKIMEIENLVSRWRELTEKPDPPNCTKAPEIREALCERLSILHRLNALGETDIEGVPLVDALVETNRLLRTVNHVRTINYEGPASQSNLA
jgi:hypothetical protein